MLDRDSWSRLWGSSSDLWFALRIDEMMMNPSTLSILERSDWRRGKSQRRKEDMWNDMRWVWRMYEMFVKDDKAPMSWLEFWLSIFVIRPLPWQVRLHGRSPKKFPNKKKNSFVLLWGEFARGYFFKPGFSPHLVSLASRLLSHSLWFLFDLKFHQNISIQTYFEWIQIADLESNAA